MCMSPSRVAQIWLGGRSIHVQGSTGASRSDGYNCRESRCPRRGLFNKYVVCRRHREREFCYVKFSSSNRWHLLKFFVAPQLRLDSRRSHFPSIHTANANSHDTIAPPTVSSSCVQQTSHHKGMKKWNTCTSMHDGSRACHSTIHSLRMGITVERPVSHPIQYPLVSISCCAVDAVSPLLFLWLTNPRSLATSSSSPSHAASRKLLAALPRTSCGDENGGEETC
jgi:hypothetical protein